MKSASENMKPRVENQVLIIAEAGVNHNGELALAKKMVDVAKSAGADIVKFQTFKTEKLVSKFARKADYQTQATGAGESQQQMLKKLELSESDFLELVSYCETKGIRFLSTAFDSESLVFLNEKIQQNLFKIPSGEITNLPFLLEHGETRKDIILSTGMANLEEIAWALCALAAGATGQGPGVLGHSLNPKTFLQQKEVREYLSQKVCLLHCTTQYPAPWEAVNLKAMAKMQNEFQVQVGYSDHTEGLMIPVAAVAAGARVIEKHFTLDKAMPGPDHQASLDPQELHEMVRQIRNLEVALGTDVKAMAPIEVGNAKVVRKSLLAKKAIKKGQRIEEDLLAIKRPGDGISPRFYWEVLGKTANRDYQEDELLDSEILTDGGRS